MTKEANHLITGDEILQILTRYRIGKKPLSLLLGWGQTTILRYLSGITPTPEYSKELLRVKDDPQYYYQLLMKNNQRITNVAFRKSQHAVLSELIGSKISLIAQYVVNRADGDISAKRVQAILYYSQCFSLALRGTPIFEDEYIIYSLQMPYPDIYSSMRNNGCHVLSIPEQALQEDDLYYIDSIYQALQWYGPEAIRIVTNSERADLHKMKVTNNAKKIVSKTTLQEYFLSCFEQYNITKPSEINSYYNKRMADLRRLKMKTK